MEKAKISEASFVANIEAVDNLEADQEQKAVEGRTDIGPTQKAQLVQSRRGQGIFKANVRLNETKCRVTGLSDPRFLIASHIKPWSQCSDREKLDGCNGLLLSPHIDRLFDKGWISFTDQGDILFSTKIGASVLDLWGLARSQNVGRFSPEQSVYLEFHRNSVFRR